jgi:hypothetical protein
VRPDKFILVGHEPAPEPDLLAWGRWMGDADRQVRHTEQGDVRVSTVFLGLDHQFGDGPPLLFETMTFVGDDSVSCERYSTWAEAEAGHDRAVAEVFKPTPIMRLP